MHLREVNEHRQRLANSIQSFVDAAATPEQRDMILAQLVDALSSFGRSGLVDGADDSAGRMMIENVTRGVLPSRGGEG